MNPIPQRLPSEVIGTQFGDELQQLVNAATLIRVGQVTVQIPSTSDAYLESVIKVLEQVRKGEQANPLDYKIPYSGELAAFMRELLNAIEQMR